MVLFDSMQAIGSFNVIPVSCECCVVRRQLCLQSLALAHRMIALAGQLGEVLCVGTDGAAIFLRVRGDAIASGMSALRFRGHDDLL
jgi:hypothetical protein